MSNLSRRMTGVIRGQVKEFQNCLSYENIACLKYKETKMHNPKYSLFFDNHTMNSRC